MFYRLCKIFLLCIFAIMTNSYSHASWRSCGPDCYEANTANRPDVESAINAALSNSGGTVYIPKGVVEWSTGISKTLNQDIEVIGSGQGMTTLKKGVSDIFLFNLIINSDVKFRIADLTMTSHIDDKSNSSLLQLYGETQNLVVENITFNRIGFGRAAIIGNPNVPVHIQGVMSNCIFNVPVKLGQDVTVFGPDKWTSGTNFGTEYFFFIEDCTFNHTAGAADGAIDLYRGAKVVFRHNMVIGTTIGNHGNDSSFPSAHSIEVYNNTFISNYKVTFAAHIRGGSGLFHNNSYDSNYPSSFTIGHYRSCLPFNDGRCDGTGAHDGNSDYGYPCRQQPGMTGSNGLIQSPLIEWNNSHNGGINNMSFSYNVNFTPPSCSSPSMLDHVKEGRDFLNNNTCSKNLDISTTCHNFWDSNKEMAMDYSPFSYPHPLLATFKNLESPKGLKILETD